MADLEAVMDLSGSPKQSISDFYHSQDPCSENQDHSGLRPTENASRPEFQGTKEPQHTVLQEWVGGWRFGGKW